MALNLALAAVATLLIVYIVRQFVAPMPLPVGGRRAAGPVMSTVTDTAKTPASAYNVVAARNLFSPTRTEAPSSTSVTGLPVARPNLFGVVVRSIGASVAYLEDPTTKRVAGYRVGDKIQGATVQAIKADGVTIDGPGGPMDVRLHEPGHHDAAGTIEDRVVVGLRRVCAADVHDRAVDARDIAREHGDIGTGEVA